ncbi:cyclopropane-fatty-acyl-phospholipid synthase family protein [Frigidibacter sp. MR17.24]|uniref:cyclopropane-fatty-acyl-phospholipid synthase family protein n=1 Tax=Frigidibacter sp. MR17.24 TaxID=3127345 RepID=UPI0030129ECD
MWGPLLDQLLNRFVDLGRLTLTWPDGHTTRYGSGSGSAGGGGGGGSGDAPDIAPDIAVTLSDPAIARRLVTNPDLALGEGYMQGSLRIDGDDLRGLMRLLLINLNRPRPMVWWRRPLDLADTALRPLMQWNDARRSKSNVAAHYDLSDALYDLFLDADRQYSCAYFRSPDDTLEQAQAQKKAHIAAKLAIAPGMRVLDIGCGWGGMALTLARDHGARVLGVTLSEEQHRVARDRVRAAGLEDRVEIRLTDYRAVTGTFDRIVSVGMFEHVGLPQFETYFHKVHDLLAPDGIALIHTIGRSAAPSATSPWIRKYIFPGGYVPSMSEASKAIEATPLWLQDIEVLRLHYAETLRHWEERVSARAAEVVAMYDETFLRMWRYYLIASEMSFRAGRQCVFQFQLARRVDAAPVTRDYLYPQAPAGAEAFGSLGGSVGGTLAASLGGNPGGGSRTAPAAARPGAPRPSARPRPKVAAE